MNIGVLAQEEYLKNGLQTFEKNVNSYLLQQEAFEGVYHNYRGEGVGYPFSRTVELYRTGQMLKEETEGLEKLFVPSQNRLTVDPESIDAEVIPYVHDVLPFTSSHTVSRYKGLTTIVHGVQQLFFEQNYMRNIEKLDKVIAASEKTAKDLRYRTNFTGEIEVVYQGVDNMPDPSGNDRDRDIDLIYIGTLHERKNPEFLKEVFREAQEQGFKVVSVNYEEIDLPGRTYTNISDEKMAELLERSRYYLHASFIEGFGRGPVEAQRYGCIPLGLDTEINQEILGEPLYSWIDVGDTEDVLQELKSSDNPEMRENARENSSQYTWERCRKEIEEVLRE